MGSAMHRLVLPLLLLTAAAAAQQTGPAQPAVEDLGGGRYRIGAIVLDQNAAAFTVPGRVLRLEPPLEYLAVTVGGAKGYESLLELEADAYQFNLACILIGLSNDGAVAPDYQFDRDEVVGPRVRVHVSIGTGDQRVDVEAGQLITDRGEPVTGSEWVYFGSIYTPGRPEDPFLASQAGTLIGLVHDPASIIEHRTGIGIGRYGSIAGNAAVLGEVGRELTLRVELVAPDAAERASAE
jgi:hypothetical protein